jgi:predicted transcriptional regulator
VHAIMLGCEADQAERTVYGGGYDRPVAPVGFNCRSCSRADCGQRAYPAIRRTPSRVAAN